ncbi:MAG: hypothetical protein JO213_11065 [Alphaproteobacteria bacterium]|nr:hypothetical protein [Alphaproteobacteria bacterium]
MVFVLYLAGLAVLIVVLALGLEFVQRRRTMPMGEPVTGRSEPLVASAAASASPAAASPAIAAPAAAMVPATAAGADRAQPVSAPWQPAARGGAVRDIVLIVAVALLALIALGSDWVFYRQLDEMRAARRAWLAPQSASSDKAPVVGRPFEVSVLTQNSGAEPATDIFTDAAPFTVALADAGSPSVDRKIRDALNRCLATKPGDRTRVIYPTASNANDRTVLSIKRELIDWDVLYGTKILVVPGCFAYRSAGQTHHSAFCFFYQHGFSNSENWPICQGGNYAD